MFARQLSTRKKYAESMSISVLWRRLFNCAVGSGRKRTKKTFGVGVKCLSNYLSAVICKRESRAVSISAKVRSKVYVGKHKRQNLRRFFKLATVYSYVNSQSMRVQNVFFLLFAILIVLYTMHLIFIFYGWGDSTCRVVGRRSSTIKLKEGGTLREKKTEKLEPN